MSRQRYESTDDMFHEQQAMALVRRAFGYHEILKLPSSYQMDWCPLDRKRNVLAWIEFKGRRTVRHDTYNTYVMSASKFRAGYAWTLSTRLPFIAVFSWSDKTVYYHFQQEHRDRFTFQWGGRATPRDPWDQEPMIHVPRDLFTEIVIKANHL